MTPEVVSMWATPVARVPLALDEQLIVAWRDRLVQAAEELPSWAVSNAGGTWHSPPTLASDPRFEPAGRALADAALSVFAQLAARRGGHPGVDVRLTAWAMVTPHGGYTVPHDHAQRSDFSVVLPLDLGDADDTAHPQSGRLVLHDPRTVPRTMGGVTLFPDDLTLTHEVGTAVVFPGWVRHWVHPYRGQRPRVVVSANVELVPR